MPLHRLADEGQHGFEREALLKDPSPASSGRTHHLPEQVNPEIDQDKGQGDVKQPQHGILGSGADAGVIFDAIAGLNTEAVAVMAMYLRPSHVGPINHIEQVLDAVLPLSAVAVATDDDHGAGYRAMGGAAQGIGGLIAALSFAEHTGAARFAPDNGGHDQREFQGHQPANHRHAVKAPVKIEPLHLHGQRVHRVEQAGDNRHCGLSPSDGMNRQSDPPMRTNDVHRGVGKKGRSARFGLRPIDIRRFRLTRLTIVGQQV